MNTKTPLIALLAIMLACLVLAGTVTLVTRADESYPDTRKTHTPTPTDRPTNTPPPTMTSVPSTPVPNTPTPQPPTPRPPTVTPTSKPPKDVPTGDICIVPRRSVGELFTMDNWRMFYGDPERLERHVVIESWAPICTHIKVGSYIVLWWNSETGHAGRAFLVRVIEDQTVWVREK